MTKLTQEVVFKNSSRRNSKSNNDRHNLHGQGLPKKKPESAIIQRMRPKKTESAKNGHILPINAEVSNRQPTVRVIMRSGVVQAFGRFPGKESSIPFRNLLLV